MENVGSRDFEGMNAPLCFFSAFESLSVSVRSVAWEECNGRRSV